MPTTLNIMMFSVHFGIFWQLFFFSILSPERNNHVLNPNRKTFLRFLLFDPGTNFNLSMLIKADCCSCPLMEAMLLPLGRMHKCFMKGEYHRPSKDLWKWCCRPEHLFQGVHGRQAPLIFALLIVLILSFALTVVIIAEFTGNKS